MRSDRLLGLLLLLQTHGQLSSRDLAERLEVSERTIFRDIESLGAAGVPVYATRGRNGGCRLMPHYRTDLTGLTAEEARALFIFADRGTLGDLGLEGRFQSAMRKLMAGLPEPHRPMAQDARDRVVVDPRGWMRTADETPCLDTVQRAVWSARRLRLTYRHSGATGARELVVDPYGLVAKAGVWYLIAAEAGEPRLYRVSRINVAVVTEEAADRPADLDLDALWTDLRRRVEDRGPGVHATIRVLPERVEMLLRICASQLLAPTERLPETDVAGWTVLRLRFPSEGAARGSLLSFGADVEVLEPATLRRGMVDAAQELIALYSAATPS